MSPHISAFVTIFCIQIWKIIPVGRSGHMPSTLPQYLIYAFSQPKVKSLAIPDPVHDPETFP